MDTRAWVVRQLRKRGVALRHYHFTGMARKHQILDRFAVDLLVDVGANIGQTGNLYREGGYTGRILSLEPDSASFARLQAAAAADPLWECQRVAVGAEPGELVLNISDEPQFNSVLPVTARTVQASPRARYVRTETVPVRTLDDLVGEVSHTSLALKIDVQGFEGPVLDGGAKALAAAHMVDIELCPVELYEGQTSMLDLMARMEAEGFTLMFMEDTYNDMTLGQALAFNGVYARL